MKIKPNQPHTAHNHMGVCQTNLGRNSITFSDKKVSQLMLNNHTYLATGIIFQQGALQGSQVFVHDIHYCSNLDGTQQTEHDIYHLYATAMMLNIMIKSGIAAYTPQPTQDQRLLSVTINAATVAIATTDATTFNIATAIFVVHTRSFDNTASRAHNIVRLYTSQNEVLCAPFSKVSEMMLAGSYAFIKLQQLKSSS